MKLIRTAATSIMILAILNSVPQLTFAGTKINRLFTTPDLRAQIDNYRKNPELYKAKKIINNEKGEKQVIPTKKNIILKGIITKPDGSKVAWINNLESNQVVKQNKNVANDTVLIQVDGKKSIPLKVGQIYQVEQNTISEIFNKDEADIEDEAKNLQNVKKDDDKHENNEQSVEAPHEITKTIIDIVNAKKAANKAMQNGMMEP